MNLRKKIAIAGTIILGLAVLTPIVHHFQLKIRTNQLRSQLRSKGVLKPVSQLAAPAVPQDQDGSPILLGAMKLAPTWDEINQSLKSCQPALDELVKIAKS